MSLVPVPTSVFGTPRGPTRPGCRRDHKVQPSGQDQTTQYYSPMYSLSMYIVHFSTSILLLALALLYSLGSGSGDPDPTVALSPPLVSLLFPIRPTSTLVLITQRTHVIQSIAIRNLRPITPGHTWFRVLVSTVSAQPRTTVNSDTNGGSAPVLEPSSA